MYWRANNFKDRAKLKLGRVFFLRRRAVSEIKKAVKTSIDKIFAEQKRYALELRKSDYRQRLDVLERFQRVFNASLDKIYAAAAADFGKPEAEVAMAEIMPVVAELKHIRKNLKKMDEVRTGYADSDHLWHSI